MYNDFDRRAFLKVGSLSLFGFIGYGDVLRLRAPHLGDRILEVRNVNRRIAETEVFRRRRLQRLDHLRAWAAQVFVAAQSDRRRTGRRHALATTTTTTLLEQFKRVGFLAPVSNESGR